MDAPLDLVIEWLDLIGIGVFAISGALTASRKQMDIVGFILIATVTGIGGGTLRDILLGIDPVYWIYGPRYVLICIAAAIVVFFAAPWIESRYRTLTWADAIGMAAFCVIGAQRALDTGAPAIAAILMGLVTASFGGIIRDVLCDEQPLILRQDIYATAAATGALVYVLAKSADLPTEIAAPAGFATAFGLRAAGLLFDITLPVYRSRPGRPYPEKGDRRRGSS